jgi:hypothetical protein
MTKTEDNPMHLQPRLRRARKAGQHAGVRRTRRHAVHTDSRLGDLERHRLGDAFDGVLAADIDGGPRRTLVPVGREDVDNATAALSLHERSGLLCEGTHTDASFNLAVTRAHGSRYSENASQSVPVSRGRPAMLPPYGNTAARSLAPCNFTSVSIFAFVATNSFATTLLRLATGLRS